MNREDWYLIQVRKGCELAVKESLEREIIRSGLSDAVWAVLVPTRKRLSIRTKRPCGEEVILKGWVIINCESSRQLGAIIAGVPGTIGPILRSCAEDIRTFLDTNSEIAGYTAVPATDIEVGQSVRITGGPFAGLDATIEEIASNNQSVIVETFVFKRKVRLSLNINQIERC